jgi:hypothetical protein
MTSSIRNLAPRIWEYLAVLGVILFYEVAGGIFEGDSHEYANIIGPTLLGFVLIAGAWERVRCDPNQIWTALWWFRISTCVYFCFGSMVPILASQTVLLHLQSMYAFQGLEILKLNRIVAISVFTVLLSSQVVILMAARQRPLWQRAPEKRDPSDRNIFRAGMLFLLVGGLIRYVLVFPNEIGWTNRVIPGGIIAFSQSILVAIYLLTLWSLKKNRAFLPFVIFLVLLEVIVGLLLFNKSAVLFPLIVFSLGWLQIGVTKRKVGLQQRALS